MFNITVHEANSLFQFTLAPKTANISLPPSPYIPRRFTNKNISKVSKQCISEGKISIHLVNYCATVEGFSSYSNPQIITSIYVAEAPPEALQHLWDALQRGPNKRNAVEVQEEREVKRKLPQQSHWNMLNVDVIRMIFAFLDDGLGKYSLISRKWMQMIGEIARVLRFKYSKNVTGETIIRIIKRHPFLHKISLNDCRNLQISNLKKAITLPLKSVKFLSIEGCKKISSQALYTMILNAPNLAHLNIIQSGVDQQFFLDLNPKVHLKHLTSIQFSVSGHQGIKHLSQKFQNLRRLEMHTDLLTAPMMFHILKLLNLYELKVFYENIEMIPSFQSHENLQIVDILPKENFSPNNASFQLWDSFAACKLRHVGCNLPRESLEKLLKYWPDLASITLCEYFPLPSSIIRVKMHFNDDFDNEIKRNDGEKWMGNLKSFDIVMQRLEYYKTEQIQEYFRRNYPNCQAKIIST